MNVWRREPHREELEIQIQVEAFFCLFNIEYLGSARILFVVPLVYTILNTPFYFTRIVDTFAMNLFNNMELFFSKELGQFNKFGVFFYNASHYLYYANFASDFLVYAFSRLAN
jgi:hypothetical protein